MNSGLAGQDPFPDWTRRLAAFDHSALQLILDVTHDGLVWYARRMIVDESVSKDLVQVAFIR